jgi:hypothetical protein
VGAILHVMAGLVPAIHVLHDGGMRSGYVYFLTNRPNGIFTSARQAISLVAFMSIASALLLDLQNATR